MTEHKPGCTYNDCDPCSCGASITEQPECETCDGARNVGGSGYLDEQGKYIETKTVDCPDCKPNTNTMIVKTIQGFTHLITNSLEKLPDGTLRREALDDIGIFESGVLYKLQEEYDD